MSEGSLFDSADVLWDAKHQHPRRIRGSFPLPAEDSPSDAILSFLSEYSDELRLPSPSESLFQVLTTDTPTGRIVRFEQKFEDIPIFGTEVVVAIDRGRRVTQIDLAHEPVPRPVAAAGDTKLQPRAALKAATDALGEFTQRAKPQTPTQVYFPTAQGLRLAYLALIPTREPAHDWRVFVDAYTGEVLKQEDILVDIDGHGLVFDPNPVVTANNDTLRDPAATVAACTFAGTAQPIINAQQLTRTLRDLTLTGGVHRLEGPFVRMQNFGAPASTIPEEADPDAFNYSSDDERFEAVNVYYHVDTFQRYLQDGSQGPSITTARNSQIPCDPHEGSGSAFYSPIDRGLHFSNSGPCRPDRAEDGHVMTHEYGHAIQHDQVPTWGGANPVTGRQETRAMGEGYGDAMACIFFADHGGGFRREVFEQWIFGDQGGLRRVDGTKVYPGSWVNQVHADGEIWSAALWNIYRTIGGDSMNPADRQAARHNVIKTVTLSHHRLLGNASMPDGAEAVMVENAALDQYLGRHLPQMLDSFHSRGLLVCDANADLEISDGATFWNSPDLWIRNSDDGGMAHQSPEFGQDNWFHARVRNVGIAAARSFVVLFNVKPWAGTEFLYPGDYLPCISAAVGFNLAPGAATVVKAKWPAALVPAAGTHACWLAAVYTPTDAATAGLHVWEHNNLAQKNLTVVDLVPGDSIVVPVQLGNLAQLLAGVQRLEVRRPEQWRTLPVALVHRNPEIVRALARSVELAAPPPAVARPAPMPTVRFLEPALVEIGSPGAATPPVRIALGRDSAVALGPASGGGANGGGGYHRGGPEADLVTDREGLSALALRPGLAVGLPVALRPRQSVAIGLKVGVPPEARPGDVLAIDLVQRNAEGAVVGGVTVQINVVAK